MSHLRFTHPMKGLAAEYCDEDSPMLNVAQVPARPPARATKDIINPVQSAYMSSLQSCKDVLTSYPPPAPLSLCPLLPWPPSSMPATASTTPLPHRTTRLAAASMRGRRPLYFT